MADGGRTQGGRKRKANDDVMDDDNGLSPSGKARGKQLETENAMGFEDPFEDEFDEENGEEDVEMMDQDDEAMGNDDEGAMDVSQAMDDEEEPETQVRTNFEKNFCRPETTQLFPDGIGDQILMNNLLNMFRHIFLVWEVMLLWISWNTTAAPTT